MSLTSSVKKLARSNFSECTFHAFFETHVRKLILVDFDGHNANITLKICTDVVYIHVYVV